MGEREDIAALADPVAWARAAARLLADLGFSLVNSDHPAAPGGPNLLVALRDRPTLRHFDPELVSFWVAAEGRGRIATLDRRQDPPGTLAVSWGHVHVVDRLDVKNRFLTFGGSLRAAALEPALTVVALRSPGPIVRWGGHSQGYDPLAGAIGAFFGRLMVRVDYQRGAEQLLAGTPALELYGAFLRDALRRAIAVERFCSTDVPLRPWLATEVARLRRGEPVAWSGGRRLLSDLNLAR